MADFRRSVADQPNILHLRAHTFAPFTELFSNTLIQPTHIPQRSRLGADAMKTRKIKYRPLARLMSGGVS
jgi:hypothetical protein